MQKELRADATGGAAAAVPGPRWGRAAAGVAAGIARATLMKTLEEMCTHANCLCRGLHKKINLYATCSC